MSGRDASGSPSSGSPSGRELDAETRQQVIDLLCEAFAEDRIPLEEFERRVESVHRMERVHEVRELLAQLDLATPEGGVPAPSTDSAMERGGGPVPAAAGARGPRHPTVSPDRVAEQSVIVGILGGGGRSGRWVPARTNWAVAVCAGLEIDFREAVMPPGVTELRVSAVWAGVEIIVPPDIRLECSVAGILGGVDHNETVDPTPDPDAPVLRVTGIALMGGVEVTTRYPGETGREAKRRRKGARRERKRLGEGS